MMQTLFSWEKFSSVPIMGIVRNHSFEALRRILPIYINSGLSTIEITMNTPEAQEMIRYSRENFNEKLNIGAGTVCNVGDLNKAIKAGAQFIVTPFLDKKIIKFCVNEGIPIFSGAFSPTEIYKAWSWGASEVKIYPATTLEPQFIKDIKGPLPQIKLMPTGGLTLENLNAFKKAGANSFGIGNQLFNREIIAKGNWEALKRHFEEFVEIVKQ